MNTKQLNEKAIAGMYHADKRHQAVLKAIASMPRQNETLVEALDKKLSHEKGLTHRDIVDTLKALDRFGAGEFIPGRRGHPSRFKWSVDSIHVATLDVAFPTQEDHDNVIPMSGFSETGGTMLIKHKYALRPNMVVTLELPSDLTVPEVERLSMFLRSLPFFHQAPAIMAKAAGA